MRERELCGNCDAGLPMNCTCPPSLPHNEQQSLIDRLEGASDPFGDFAQGDDYDDDWIDE